jgi:hypothetical protein
MNISLLFNYFSLIGLVNNKKKNSINYTIDYFNYAINRCFDYSPLLNRDY